MPPNSQYFTEPKSPALQARAAARFPLRFLITAAGALLIALAVRPLFELSLAEALLIATPGCLMLGSLATLWHLAVNSDKIDAKKQLTALLVVEFVLVPLGAAAALIAFFVLRNGAS